MKKKKKQGKKRKWLIPLAVVLLAAVVFSVLVGTKVIRKRGEEAGRTFYKKSGGFEGEFDPGH